MLNKGGSYGSVLAILVIGGHSVAVALMERQIKSAVLESLGVAACVVIFVALYSLVKFMQQRGE